MKVVDDFMAFAIKGNAIDMAIGIVIGAAFNKIVNSMVNDLFMPPIGLMIGGVAFNDLKWVLKKPVLGADGAVVAQAVSINYGSFINSLIEFFIIALSAFIAIRVMRHHERQPLPHRRRLDASLWD